jgi:NAD(P)-dependent dehydrogenase (short-subunit alcohol dehydrogenase family)
VVSQLSGAGHRAYGVDVADEASVVGLFDQVEDEHSHVAVLASFAAVGAQLRCPRLPQIKISGR